MSDEPVPPRLEENAPSPKWRFLCSRRYMILFGSILLASTAVIFLSSPSWFAPNPDSMLVLKNQVEDLGKRVSHLEAARKTSPAPPIEPKQLTEIDTRLTTLYEQLEALRTQSKVDGSSQPSEPALTLRKNLEKEVENLGKTQKTLKSLLLFLRLKAKVLSEAPYSEELADFKMMTNNLHGLKILEKYADQGLQALKEKPQGLFSPPGAEGNSWWDRLKAMATPLIRIEKVDAPLSFDISQDRQAVEEALTQIEQTLTQQLTPIPGDAS